MRCTRDPGPWPPAGPTRRDMKQISGRRICTDIEMEIHAFRVCLADPVTARREMRTQLREAGGSGAPAA